MPACASGRTCFDCSATCQARHRCRQRARATQRRVAFIVRWYTVTVRAVRKRHAALGVQGSVELRMWTTNSPAAAQTNRYAPSLRHRLVAARPLCRSLGRTRLQHPPSRRAGSCSPGLLVPTPAPAADEHAFADAGRPASRLPFPGGGGSALTSGRGVIA